MSNPSSNPKGMTRREFLLVGTTLGATIAAAGAVGWGTQQAERANQLAEALPAGGQGAMPPTPAQDFANTIASKDGEIMRLAGELSAAQQQIQQLQALLSESQTAAANSAQALTSLQNDHATAQNENQYLKSLVDLFEQLEAVGFDDVVSAAMGTFSAVWSALAVYSPRFEAGRGLVIPLLDQFDISLGDWRANLGVVSDLVEKAQSLLELVQETASAAVEKVSQVSEPITDFVSEVLRRLPFDAGKKIEIALQRVKDLVLHLPSTFSETNARLLSPLLTRVGEGAESWLATVSSPVRENVLEPLQGFIGEWAVSNAQLAENMLQPIEAARGKRAEVRAAIAQLKSNQPGA